MTRTGFYPGTFDPPTNGHLDVIHRAIRLVDSLIVAVAANPGKETLFDIGERVAMLEAELAGITDGDGGRVRVRPFDNLLMDFVAEVETAVIIRGLRAVSDFEYEFQMAGMNARLNPGVETVFLMASDRHQFISSKLVKEIGRLGGDVGHFVPPGVGKRLAERLG